MSDIIIGDVPESMRDTVKEDCIRALYSRLDGIDQKGIISFSFVFPFIMSCVCIAHKRVIAYKISSNVLRITKELLFGQTKYTFHINRLRLLSYVVTSITSGHNSTSSLE